MTLTGFYRNCLKIQQDVNFDGTIKKAIETNSYPTLKLVLEYLFQELNTIEYQSILMFNLPLIL